MERMLFLVPVVGLLGLLFAVILGRQTVKEDPGTDRMREIADAITEGTNVFLAPGYRILVASVVVLFFVVGFRTRNWITAGCFLVGSGFSITAGYLGMDAAAHASSHTAGAVYTSGMHRALTFAFSDGSVMGMAVAGLGPLGVDVFYILTRDVSILSGFSLGVSSIALFTRAGRGIYTEAVDVSTGLVGKVEIGIPENDLCNPAIIANNVGDNVGDATGIGADLLESYVGSLTSALTLDPIFYWGTGIVFPLMLSVCGIIAAIIGSLLVKSIGNFDPHKALKTGEYSATVLIVVCSLILNRIFLGNFMAALTIATGLLAGVLIGVITEIYVPGDYRFVKKIAGQFETGSATTIISGTAVGVQSTAASILPVCVGVLTSNKLMGLYGTTLAAVNVLSITGITATIDTYGPIADDAGGIVEMAGLDRDVGDIADKLDSVGDTIAAIGKNPVIGSVTLTALALSVSYAEAIKLTTIDILNTHVVAGLFIGGMLTLLFFAMTMESVSKTAHQMTEEVRHQFREKPGILKGADRPGYISCVSISTKAVLWEMFPPGLMVVLAPLTTDFILRPSALGGLLTDAPIAGVLMAIFMSNSGGAWDSVKKYIGEGYHRGRGDGSRKAAVAGDTVGDLFKDTSGPSISILIKLTTIVSLVLAPLFLRFGGLI